jgi:hypothetical protein
MQTSLLPSYRSVRFGPVIAIHRVAPRRFQRRHAPFIVQSSNDAPSIGGAASSFSRRTRAIRYPVRTAPRMLVFTGLAIVLIALALRFGAEDRTRRLALVSGPIPATGWS